MYPKKGVESDPHRLNPHFRALYPKKGVERAGICGTGARQIPGIPRRELKVLLISGWLLAGESIPRRELKAPATAGPSRNFDLCIPRRELKASIL